MFSANMLEQTVDGVDTVGPEPGKYESQMNHTGADDEWESDEGSGNQQGSVKTHCFFVAGKHQTVWETGRNQESEDRTCGQGQKAGAVSRIQAGQYQWQARSATREQSKV